MCDDTRNIAIQIAASQDFDNWLMLAQEVEFLFGPMSNEPSFHQALQRAFREQRAFCVRAQNGMPGARLCGGILISKKRNSIGWLAVARQDRGKGIGKALLVYAIQQLNPDEDISVTTFTQAVEEGLPARHVYRHFGFRDTAPHQPTPAGVPTVVMVRPKDQHQ